MVAALACACGDNRLPETPDHNPLRGSYDTWEEIELPGTVCGNDSQYKFWINYSDTSDNLAVVFEPGGAFAPIVVFGKRFGLAASIADRFVGIRQIFRDNEFFPADHLQNGVSIGVGDGDFVAIRVVCICDDRMHDHRNAWNGIHLQGLAVPWVWRRHRSLDNILRHHNCTPRWS